MVDKRGLEKRNQKLVDNMESLGVSAVVVTNPSNQEYFSGFDAGAAVVIFKDKEPVCIVPRLEYSRALKKCLLGDVVAFSRSRVETLPDEKVEFKDQWILTLQILDEEGLKKSKIGIELDRISVKNYNTIKSTNYKFEDIGSTISYLRSIKEPSEIASMRQAIKLTEAALSRAINMLEPGITETEISAEIEKSFKTKGFERAFQTIVAFGENSAFPHSTPSPRILKRAEFVLIDVGAKVDSYCADITRTLVFDKCNEKQETIITTVSEAQENAISKISSSVKAEDVDGAARKLLSSFGYGGHFSHGVGHGVGLDVHEKPSLSPGSKDILHEGMIVTIEPGIYFRGYGGVRIEDMVLVQSEGCEKLTSFRSIIPFE